VVLVLLAVTYNAAISSANTRNRIMTATCAVIAERLCQAAVCTELYTGPEDLIFKPLFLEDMHELGYRLSDERIFWYTTQLYPGHLCSPIHYMYYLDG
jgi:hypothetical protein